MELPQVGVLVQWPDFTKKELTYMDAQRKAEVTKKVMERCEKKNETNPAVITKMVRRAFTRELVGSKVRKTWNYAQRFATWFTKTIHFSWLHSRLEVRKARTEKKILDFERLVNKVAKRIHKTMLKKVAPVTKLVVVKEIPVTAKPQTPAQKATQKSTAASTAMKPKTEKTLNQQLKDMENDTKAVLEAYKKDPKDKKVLSDVKDVDRALLSLAEQLKGATRTQRAHYNALVQALKERNGNVVLKLVPA